MTETSLGAGEALDATRRFLSDLLGGSPQRDFAVRLSDGSTWTPNGSGEPRFTLVLRHPGALHAMFSRPSELSLGEAFVRGDFDVEGDFEGIFPLAEVVLAGQGRLQLARHAARLLSLPRVRARGALPPTARLRGRLHSPARDRRAIAYHYDLSNDFFELFLGRRMVYSCAYFESSEEELDDAQERKLEYLCRKLRLRPGERLLDIGCGWGALLVHAAERYGVEVLGITLSERQAELAEERIRCAGLGARCRVELRDYRELDESESFDKIVSVGMFEHVGAARLPEYFRRAHHLLKTGGVFLNHGIARSALASGSRGNSFVGRYVFPDGVPVPLATTIAAAEPAA